MDGIQLKVAFVTDDHEAYQFSTIVVGRKKNAIPILMIQRPEPSEIVKIQRREFVRVKRAVDVSVHPLHNEFDPFVTITEDISAGGASLYVPKETSISNSQVLLCWFVLPRQSGNNTYLKLRCRVVRIVELNDAQRIVSVQFLDKTIQEEQQIIRFCYEAQLALRQKERRI